MTTMRGLLQREEVAWEIDKGMEETVRAWDDFIDASFVLWGCTVPIDAGIVNMD
jgi:hypothetical protein